MSPTMLTYADLGRHLQNIGAETDPAESHGLLTGLIATGNLDADSLIEEVCPPVADGDVLGGEGRGALLDLAQDTINQFNDPTFVFSPMLPEDDTPLRDRAYALRAWCEGFLYGLGIGEANQHNLPAGVVESVDDLGELTRLNVSIIGESEEEEQALADLLEYVRAAVMMIQDELGATPD